MTDPQWLVRRALKVLQSDDTPLYLFTLAAEEVDLVADVARIGRDEAGKLIGYQRPEKQKHVKQIQEYLDSEDPLFPNGLILALPPEVKFKSSRGPTTTRRTGCRRNARDPDSSRRRWPAPGVDRRWPAAKPCARSHQEPPTTGAGGRLRRALARTPTRAVPAGQHRPAATDRAWSPNCSRRSPACPPHGWPRDSCRPLWSTC